MSKRSVLFKETDLRRAVRGVVKAGVTVDRVEIDRNTGNIAVITRSPELSSSPSELLNEWDGTLDDKTAA